MQPSSISEAGYWGPLLSTSQHWNNRTETKAKIVTLDENGNAAAVLPLDFYLGDCDADVLFGR